MQWVAQCTPITQRHEFASTRAQRASKDARLQQTLLCLNDSERPNVCSIVDGAWFEALRDNEAGEALFVDCGTIVSDEESA
ncbi:hypothetical protein GEMMAAP_19615 [Gemmatimonas phototrophica]|uniref:Uncharacterized protein n=1 Tax=Gemmatimonas phototrophica TaxID=1379270 RepID=A0A143BPL7_9BACT|nr:hypothetical protein GEMMAAP_19615 [Gemmatimonas phototrophica]